MIEDKTVEVSRVNHELSLICNENEDLKNQKLTLEKLVRNIDDKPDKTLIDSHIPNYTPRNKRVNDENLPMENEGGNENWTDVINRFNKNSNNP